MSSTTSELTYSYQPPQAGCDITLRSSDGTTFHAHSLLLRLASPGLVALFADAPDFKTFELDDDAMSIALMLRFIYPPAVPGDLSIELLEKTLYIAHKYQVTGTITSVDLLMSSHSFDKGSLIRRDPVRTFCLAATYGLPRTRKASTEALHPGNFRFGDLGEIKSLANTCGSSASLVGLLGAHYMRIKKLSDLLLGENQSQILPDAPTDSGGPATACNIICYDEGEDAENESTEDESAESGDDQDEEYGSEENKAYKPTWFGYWTMIAFHELASRPLDECDYLFQTSVLDEFLLEQDTCGRCIELARTGLSQGAFLQWAQKTKRVIRATLEEIECLYN
ncbi:hypothetical protein FRC12_008552 [Ceratobasidium sp. 428]|nr:hypothetical protein FRC12_008552 [Ceratobasidium sp. 428]